MGCRGASGQDGGSLRSPPLIVLSLALGMRPDRATAPREQDGTGIVVTTSLVTVKNDW